MAALVQTAANVVAGSGTVRTHAGTAGGTVTAGMPVYADAADSNALKPARANAAGTATVAGIARNGASDGQPMVYQSTGQINLGATLVVGEIYCLSDAVAGQIVPYGDLAPGDFVVPLGVAISASILQLEINNSGIAKP